MKQRLSLLLLTAIVWLSACQKETSYESQTNPSEGSLQSETTGDCLPKNVFGIYEVGTDLNSANNYIEVTVNVTKGGGYRIVTDTVNGMSFKATGNFSATGPTIVKLLGAGKPETAGISNFVVTYGASQCIVQVTVVPTGGAVPAIFTLKGAPNACMNYTLSGPYQTGITMTSANTVVINVNVTTAGTYDITTVTSNGITFHGTGTLALGDQTITLTASGTPVAAGDTNIPVATTGGSSCTFKVTVTDPPASSFDYFPRTTGSNWSYELNLNANDSLLIKAGPDTKTFGANTYVVFYQTDDAVGSGFDTSGYYRKAGGSYYQYVDLAGYWGYDNVYRMEFIILKDDVAANTSWQSTPFPFVEGARTGMARNNNKVIQKDVSVQVNGITYPNTIVVEERLEEQNAGGGWDDQTTLNGGYTRSYYARGIGLVQIEVMSPLDTRLGFLNLRRKVVL